ncbi:cytochrome c oxidase assembly protein [Actinocorallia populi]|uniref:cytochrome c oxidase assembly protein n=1 Tax=Actinocorallia populi TaxID=2079200 RepID=UPI000D089050|nr:cytochrome c oxidase assembly protein [Actinocorallia populi]
MGDGHHLPSPLWALQWAAALAMVGVVVAYLAAASRLRHRGDAWPWPRDLSFAVGGAAVATVSVAPLPGGEFTAHMLQHLVIGMAGPLLLILARPVTLLLRMLPPGRTRRTLLAVVQSRVAAVLVFPPVAALIDVGGLWVMYRTPLLAAVHDQPWAHALLHLRVFAAGMLFTTALCRLDPMRHRYSLTLRAGTLVVASAAHAVLAKSLWAAPPPGLAFAADDLHAGARLMYYGGDLVEVGLALVIVLGWYADTGRALQRRRRRLGAVPSGV